MKNLLDGIVYGTNWTNGEKDWDNIWLLKNGILKRLDPLEWWSGDTLEEMMEQVCPNPRRIETKYDLVDLYAIVWPSITQDQRGHVGSYIQIQDKLTLETDWELDPVEDHYYYFGLVWGCNYVMFHEIEPWEVHIIWIDDYQSLLPFLAQVGKFIDCLA